MREIKFRVWCKDYHKGWEKDIIAIHENGILRHHGKSGTTMCNPETHIVMQYTGLKDKKDLTDVYEDDIIGANGEIKGNIYQMDKGPTDLVIQGFGTKDWFKTYNEAILRGCRDA